MQSIESIRYPNYYDIATLSESERIKLATHLRGRIVVHLNRFIEENN